jgi:hypothetical protein
MTGGPPPTHWAVVVLPIAGTQAPDEHPCPAGHTVPQFPQWSLSFCKSTHDPLQTLSPGRQPDEHAPPEQTGWGGLQTTLQPPQFLGSMLTGMH